MEVLLLKPNIAPFENDRQANRDKISENGEYIEIFVDSSIETCEKRDVKGLYKLARDGVIKEFTGISSPFEVPSKCELVLDGSLPLEQNVNKIVNILETRS